MAETSATGRAGDAAEQGAGDHVRHAEPAADVADHGARGRHDLVGDAAVQHQLAAEDEERDGQEREDVHAGHHLLEDDGDRQALVEDGAQGGEADGEGDRDAQDQEAEEGDGQDGQCHDGSTSSPRSSAMMCSIENRTMSTPESDERHVAHAPRAGRGSGSCSSSTDMPEDPAVVGHGHAEQQDAGRGSRARSGRARGPAASTSSDSMPMWPASRTPTAAAISVT